MITNTESTLADFDFLNLWDFIVLHATNLREYLFSSTFELFHWLIINITITLEVDHTISGTLIALITLS